ncbi:hypothetical protein RCH06_001837 [Polaromonas sp. CG_9.5]|uniref:hypothetical protein n=1 Tax=Polaromonas sp. CG_9.5 TaxID=3071705 RepID=UPI002E069047|nr:hypothetical protein [Polaromonas sp. CG_9.5]
MKTQPLDFALPRWLYLVLAVLAAAIGLASSAVTAKFFIFGLQRVEPDTFAREALIAAGLLMIVTELAAFGLAALLPKHQLRALRWQLMGCGVLLLAFESATIYVTQVTLVKAGESAALSSGTRMADLRASIDSRRAAAAGLRANAARQSGSIHGVNRVAGATALRQSLNADQQVEPLAAELARLQAEQRPTLTDVLGSSGMLAYSVARALLISIMGLVMFGAAGALLRGALCLPVRAVAVPVALPVRAQASTLPAWTTRMPKVGTAAAAAAVPMGAMAAPMATYAPPLPTPPSISAPAVLRQAQATLAGVPAQAQPAPRRARRATAVADGQKMDAGTRGKAAARYLRIKSAVLAGSLKPSVRSLQAAEGGGTLVARRYLQQLAAERVIERAGQGWVRIATAHPDQLTLDGL